MRSGGGPHRKMLRMSSPATLPNLDSGSSAAATPGPIRVFCGADRNEWLPRQVLEFSLRQCASMPIEVETIDNGDVPTPHDPRFWPYTRFSFGRFSIPARCGFAGRAIYLDSDMVALSDIAEVWRLPFGDAKILIEQGALAKSERGKQAAVMMLDCAALDWEAEKIVAGLGEYYAYNELMSLAPVTTPGDIVDAIPAGWNELDDHVPGRTRLIHYTTIRTQPWIAAGHPQAQHFFDALRRMLKAGAIDMAAIEREIAAGYVRPSLRLEIDQADAPADPDACAAVDRAAGFKAHRELLERFAERKRAIARAECQEAIARQPWLAPWHHFRYRIRAARTARF